MEREAIVFKTWSTVLIALLLMSASVNTQPSISAHSSMGSPDPLRFSFWNWGSGRFMIVSDTKLYSMELGGGFYEYNLNQTNPTAAGYATNNYEVVILSEGQLDIYYDYGGYLGWNAHYPSPLYNGVRSLLVHSSGQYLLIGRTDGSLAKIDRGDPYNEIFSFNNGWGAPRMIREFLPNQQAYVLFEGQSMLATWDITYSYVQYTWGQYNYGYAFRHLVPDRNDSQLVYVGYEGFNELHRLRMDPTTGCLMIRVASPSFSCTPDNLEMLDQFDLLFSQECGNYMLIRGYDMIVTTSYYHGNSAVFGGASTTSYFDGGSYVYTLISDHSYNSYVFSVYLSYDPNGYCVQNQNTPYCSLCTPGTYLNDYYYPSECLSGPSQGFGVDSPRGTSNSPYQFLAPCSQDGCQDCHWDHTQCLSCLPFFYADYHVTPVVCHASPNTFPPLFGMNGYTLDPCLDSNCLSCRWNGYYYCDECAPGYAVNWNTDYMCYLVPTGIPDGHGIEPTSSPLYLNPCNVSDCLRCRLDRYVCEECQPGFGLRTGENYCYDLGNMPSSLGFDLTTNPLLVEPCLLSSTCQVCAANRQICTECIPTYFLQDAPNNCHLQAGIPAGWGIIVASIPPKIASCAANCLLCTLNHTVCTSCSPPYNVISGGCVQCLSTQFFNGTICQTCDPSCTTCNGSTANSCLSCPVGFQLSTNTCVAITCSPGQYLSASTCLPCDTTCLTCSVAATTCLTCASGRYFITSTCPVCDPSCSTCNGSTSNSCLSCPVGFQLASGACVTVICNPGQYLNLSSCLICDPLCLTCQNTATNCLACPPGRFLQGSSCLPCDASCPTCNGPSASACLSCNPGKQLSAGTCIDSYCPPNKYMNSGSCTNCHSSCLTCNGGLNTNCTSCQTGMVVTEGACLPIVCPAAKYLSGNDCLNCHMYCATCSGPSSINCLSCPSGYTLKPNGFCELNCLSSEYNDNTVNLCFSCDVQCVTCTKAGRYGCSSCPPGSSLRFDGLCFKTCPPGFYYKEADNNCYPCNSSCLSCMDASQFDCLECKNGLYVLPDKTCNSPCPSGTVLTNNTHCLPCHATCTSCLNTSDTGCTECISGFFKLPNMKCDSTIPPHHYIAPGNLVKACDSSCGTCDGDGPNSCLSCRTPETHTLSQEKECVNCMERYLTDKATCSFVVRLRFEQSSVKSVNPRASASVKLTFDKESDHSTTLSLARFQAAIKLQIKELADAEYTLQFVRREGEYTVDIFSLKPPTTPVTLEASVLISQVLFSSATGFPSLVFAPVPATRPIELKEAPNAATMDSLEGIGTQSEGAISIMSQFANYFSTISIVATSPLLTPLIKFLRIFKLVSRLKLINIYYGPFLEFILNLSGMMFQLGDDPQDTKFAKFDVSTRGKLTKFKIMTVSVERVWSKYMIYFLIIVVRMYQAKLRVYIKKRKEFSWVDQIVDRIADESRIIIFTMVVVDVFFYSLHCLCHMSLGIKQSRDSNISYVLSCISVIFIIGDILLLFQSNKEMNLQKVMRKRRQDEVEEKNNRVRLRRLERLKCQPDDAVIKQEEAERDAERDGVQAEGNEGGQASDQSTKPAKKAKKTSSLAENSSQAAVNFFTEGIKTDKIGQGRYFNSISLVKLIAVEPFYVTLQLMPNLQIGSLFVIQFAYFAYFCKRAFYNRIFSSCGDVIQIFINELSILLFLTIGMVFQLAGGFNNIPTQTSSILQFVGIGCLLLSCLFGAVIIFASVFSMVWKALKKRKAKKIRDEYNRVFTANNKKEPKAQEQSELPSAQARRVIYQSAPREVDNDISGDFPKPMEKRKPGNKYTEIGARNEARPSKPTKGAFEEIQPAIDIESRGSQKNRESEKKAPEPVSDNKKKTGKLWFTKGIRRTDDNSLRAEHTRNAPEDQRIKKRRILAAKRMFE